MFITHRAQYTQCSRYQSGFNLIESMVTLFILTVGILGVVGLQSIAISAHRDSYYATQAVNLAQNMAENIRANTLGIAAYDQSDSGNIAAETAACYTASGCTPEEMAYTQLFEWNQTLAASLPQGRGIVCRDSTAPSRVNLISNNLFNAVESSCDGRGDKFVVHVFWDSNNDRQLSLERSADGTSIDPHSDGYIQFVFEP